MDKLKKYKIEKSQAAKGQLEGHGNFIELLSVLHKYKPIMITDKMFIKYVLRDHPLLQPTINKLCALEVNFKDISNGPLILVWLNKKYNKHAILLYLFYYQSMLDKKSAKIMQKEIDTLKEKLIDYFDNIKNTHFLFFNFHYVGGLLLGYTDDNIQKYYIMGHINEQIRNELPNKNDWHKLLDNEKLLRKKQEQKLKIFKKSAHYKFIKKHFKEYSNICKKWIKYMVSESDAFNELYIKYCNNITTIQNIL